MLLRWTALLSENSRTSSVWDLLQNEDNRLASAMLIGTGNKGSARAKRMFPKEGDKLFLLTLNLKLL